MTTYQIQRPREGLRQALLVHQSGTSRTELVEWIPPRFSVGSEVAVKGDARAWKVERIYHGHGDEYPPEVSRGPRYVIELD